MTILADQAKTAIDIIANVSHKKGIRCIRYIKRSIARPQFITNISEKITY